MARRDSINPDKGVLVGNKVSHSNRKTKRTFAPNLQKFTFTSEVLEQKISFKAVPSTMKTILKHDGLDSYLLNTKNSKLATEALILKKRIIKSSSKKQS